MAVEQLVVEAVEARLALAAQLEAARADRVAEGQAAVALLAEERVAEDHEGLAA